MFDDSFKARYRTLPVATYTHPHHKEPTTFIPHNHREIELIAMTAGEACFFVGSVALPLSAGDLLVIPPYYVHHAKIAPKTSYECLCFDPALLSDADLREGLEGGSLTANGAVLAGAFGNGPHGRALSAVAALKEAAPGWELEVAGQLSLLFSALKRGGHFVPAGEGAKEDRFSRAVMEYVAKRYGEPITSRELAAQLYMSGAYFCRLFKRSFGCSFSAFLLAYRIEKAKLLLKDRLPISEIALACGFHSFSYFTKVFREQSGMTPTAFRRKVKGAAYE